jgi:hypothetical protein
MNHRSMFLSIEADSFEIHCCVSARGILVDSMRPHAQGRQQVFETISDFEYWENRLHLRESVPSIALQEWTRPGRTGKRAFR